jgi:hypothetical protein
LTAAVKAVVAAGLAVRSIEVDKAGKIRILTDSAHGEPGRAGESNEWDAI